MLAFVLAATGLAVPHFVAELASYVNCRTDNLSEQFGTHLFTLPSIWVRSIPLKLHQMFLPDLTRE